MKIKAKFAITADFSLETENVPSTGQSETQKLAWLSLIVEIVGLIVRVVCGG